MPNFETRKQHRERHTREVEASQHELRASIAHTKQLLGGSETVLKRQGQETDEEAAKRR
jgi:hypothetical protein